MMDHLDLDHLQTLLALPRQYAAAACSQANDEHRAIHDTGSTQDLQAIRALEKICYDGISYCILVYDPTLSMESRA
jgi:hypothetical protein